MVIVEGAMHVDTSRTPCSQQKRTISSRPEWAGAALPQIEFQNLDRIAGKSVLKSLTADRQFPPGGNHAFGVGDRVGGPYRLCAQGIHLHRMGSAAKPVQGN